MACHGMRYAMACHVKAESCDMALPWHCSKTCHGLAMACHGAIVEFERDNVPYGIPLRNHGRAMVVHGNAMVAHGNAMVTHDHDMALP